MTSSSDRFGDLVEHIERLRDPAGGCPWDRAQDHQTLRPYMLEEAYEAIAAIDSGLPEALMDELGDVLLQVVLHSQIASERGTFGINDVIDGLIGKLVRRHPHVFGDASNALPDIVQRWNDIKAEEGGHKPPPPPLVDARKLADKLSREGHAFDDAAWDAEALDAETRSGSAIFRAIADAWRGGFEPEIALRKAIDAVRAATEESA